MRLPPGLLQKMARSRKLACAFDYDGTLAEITPTPEEASVSMGMKQALSALEPVANIVVVSSRPIASLKKKLPFLKRARFYGLHGLETPAGTRSIPLRQMREVKAAEKEIAHAIRLFKGAWIEVKKAGFTVHYRNVRGALRQKKLEKMLPRMLKRTGLRTYAGIKAVEAMAASSPTKALTLKSIASGLRKGSLLLFFGDDGEDEEAFRALKHGKNAFCIAVGRRKTAADSRVGGVRGVEELIRYIIKLLRRRRKGHALAR